MLKLNSMKKLALPFIIVALIIGTYEYTKEKPNIFIVCLVIILFMVGMFQLNVKIPSKFSDEDQENEIKDND